MGDLERTQLLIALIEDHVKSVTFDYSAIQLLANWLGEALITIKAFNAVANKLPDLIAEVRLSTGLGQFEIWTLFLDHCHWQSLSEGMLGAIGAIGDASELSGLHRSSRRADQR
jgi:hypothetical protein